MRLLHTVVSGIAEAWVWAYAYGANGRHIGAGPRGNLQYHLYPAQRSTPPPLPTDDMTGYSRRTAEQRRQYWSPWTNWASPLDIEGRLTPLCGRLRSASRAPRISQAGAPYDNGEIHSRCPDCLLRATERNITPTYIRRLADQDPWQIQRREPNGYLLPDPVTGT